MPSGNTFQENWSTAELEITDPGSGKAIPNDKTGTVPISIASGAETNTLARPARSGLRLSLGCVANSGTSRTVTVAGGYDKAGSTTLTFDAAEEFACLESYKDTASTFAWKIVAFDGVTGPSLAIDDISIADDLTVSDALDVGGNFTLTDGGTVTQLTSITTGVTLNTNSGQITTVSSTLAAGAEAEFTVTNSAVAATDTVVVNLASTSSAGTPLASCSAVAAGSFNITIANLHASSALDNTMVINFCVIGGASS